MPKQQPRTALDVCLAVSARQHAPGGTAGVAIPLEEDESATLVAILRDYDKYGTSTNLEERARHFLVIYRERESFSRVLTQDERAELNAILAPKPRPSEPDYRRNPRSSFVWPPPSWGAKRILALAAALAVVIAGGIVVATSSPQGEPPASISQEHAPAVQVAPGTTDLQNLKQNYGPWTQLTPSDQRPQTGQPAVLLLEDGGYFASTKWTITPNASGWQQDIAGNVGNIDIKGSHADITDANGSPYLVGIDQPFVVSSNPGTLLRIDPTGSVFAMTLAQATAVRQSLQK